MVKWYAFPVIFSLLAFSLNGSDKLTDDDKIELIRGLTYEYATAKVVVPRSKKPLHVDTTGKYDKAEWDDARKELGPAARVGDLVQVTGIHIEKDHIVFEINGGMKGKKKWYQNVEVGVGNRTTPIGQQNTNAPGGSYLSLDFGKPLTAIPAADVKKMLAPILDFEKRSATEQAIDSMPPEIKQAVKENRAIEGMDREQVIMAIGKPRTKTREVKDGVELEDWIYGMPPGKITFVTFGGSKVIKVRDTYAGLGGMTAPPLPTVR
jgi:hypothetical protein